MLDPPPAEQEHEHAHRERGEGHEVHGPALVGPRGPARGEEEEGPGGGARPGRPAVLEEVEPGVEPAPEGGVGAACA